MPCELLCFLFVFVVCDVRLLVIYSCIVRRVEVAILLDRFYRLVFGKEYLGRLESIRFPRLDGGGAQDSR